MYFLEKLKLDLAKAVNKSLNNNIVQGKDFEYPPENIGGDLALPIFRFAKELKQDPKEIAEIIRGTIKLKFIEKTEIKGAYVNFNLNRSLVSKEILSELHSQNIKNNYVDVGDGDRVMLEYVSPNTNKPLHLGHLRNAFLGESLANIMDFCGYNVKRSALNNDRGIAICKSMLAYKLWGNGDTPRKSKLKSDHFVGKYYVMFDEKSKKDPKLNDKVLEMLQKWENGDKPTLDLWRKMNKLAIGGYQKTYKRLGINFDKVYNESDLYNDGKKIIEKSLKDGIFSKDNNGNIVAKLEDRCNLPDKVLLRGDGTAVYATTDLALAKKRINEGYKKVFFVVGSEQDLYFKQLFCILNMLDFDNGQKKLVKDLYFKHLSYGMVMLPEGKMKSREGTVVDADDLLDKIERLIKEEVKARNDFMSEKEIDKRTSTISLAALKFYILNVVPKTTIQFNPKESISFTGKTGPYILYSYARLHSIWRKGKDNTKLESLNFDLVKENEVWKIVFDIGKFPEYVLSALNELNPEDISSYAYSLSLKVSDFYHNVQVLDANLPERRLRIAIIESLLDILKKSLALLGIDTLEEM